MPSSQSLVLSSSPGSRQLSVPQQSAKQASLDALLEAVDIHLDAFAICEIGRCSSLACGPLDCVVVHFVLKGEGFLECEQGRYRLSQGTVVVVPRRFGKSLRGMGPIEQIYDSDAACPLQEGMVSFRALGGEADLVLGCAILTATAGGDLPLFHELTHPLVEADQDGTMDALFNMVLHELQHARVGTRAFVSALMKQIVIVLLRSKWGTQSPLSLLVTDSRLSAALVSILSRPQDNHTVDTLAAMAGMSRSRFSHHFSAACHCRPKEFVQQVRLASAAKLLRGSNLPVKSIAASVGFASRSHFSRAFQAKFGLDPSSFRRTTEDSWTSGHGNEQDA